VVVSKGHSRARVCYVLLVYRFLNRHLPSTAYLASEYRIIVH
jgi:hypothetical protein